MLRPSASPAWRPSAAIILHAFKQDRPELSVACMCRQEIYRERKKKQAADAKAKTEGFAGMQLSFDENASSAWPLPGALWQCIFSHLTGLRCCSCSHRD